MAFKIITDSTVNLPHEYLTANEIGVVTLFYLFDGESFPAYDGENTPPIKNFYERMRKKPKVSTSCANENQYYEEFEKGVKSGLTVLYVGFSNGVSASYSCALKAKEEILQTYPNAKIYCVDTLTGSLGQGHFVMQAVKMRSEGQSAETVYNYILVKREKLNTFVTVDDLYFLYQGGRIPSLTYKVGTLIKIKPIIKINSEGKLVFHEKVISRKHSLTKLFTLIRDNVSQSECDAVYITHGDCEEDALLLSEKIKLETNIKNITIDYLEPVIGAHTGAGGLAVFFFSEKKL